MCASMTERNAEFLSPLRFSFLADLTMLKITQISFELRTGRALRSIPVRGTA